MILPRLMSPRSLLLPSMLDSIGTYISQDILDHHFLLEASSYIYHLNTSETYMLERVTFTLPSKPTVMSDSGPSFAFPFRPGPESPVPASGATIPSSDLPQQPRGVSICYSRGMSILPEHFCLESSAERPQQPCVTSSSFARYVTSLWLQ